MKHGNKFQQVKKRGFTKSIWNGSVVVISVILIVVLTTILIIQKNRDGDKKLTVYRLMESKQFVAVQTNYDTDNEPSVNFDLKNKNIFTTYGTVIKGSDVYVRSGKVQKSANKEYIEYERDLLTPIILKCKTSKFEIKANGFVITTTIDKMVDTKYLQEENPRKYIENLYKVKGMRKARITFNKDYLPIKLEGYYEDKAGKKSWHMINIFTYPYKTQEEFDKDMDEEIELIKNFRYSSR